MKRSHWITWTWTISIEHCKLLWTSTRIICLTPLWFDFWFWTIHFFGNFLGIISQQYVFSETKFSTILHPPFWWRLKSPITWGWSWIWGWSVFCKSPAFAAMETFIAVFFTNLRFCFFSVGSRRHQVTWLQASFVEEMCGEILFKIDFFQKTTRRSKIFAKFTLCFFSHWRIFV